MTFWRIEGEAANGSNGGRMVVFAITDDETNLPNPHDVISEVGTQQYQWYRIDSVSRVGTISQELNGEPGAFIETMESILTALKAE